MSLSKGAKHGIGRGFNGSNAYALVTKSLNVGFVEKSTGILYDKEGYRSVSVEQIRANIDELYEVAKSSEHKDKRFLISYKYETWPNGTPKKSLNGYTSQEMLEMFIKDKDVPNNIVFHESYKPHIEKLLKNKKGNKMELHYGNLIEKAINGEFDVIIHGANSFHTMGAGIALHIRKNFPEAYEADKKTGYGDKNKLGTFSEAQIEKNGNKFVVINAYTQYEFGGNKDHFEYDKFPQLLKSIKEKYGDKRIGIPLIGCGLAGGNEPVILEMIREHFDGVDYKLVELDVNRKLKLKNENNYDFKSISSDYYPSVFEYKGLTFISNQQFIAYSKAKNFKDELVAEKILEINNNEIIKSLLNDKNFTNTILTDENVSKEWSNIIVKIEEYSRNINNYNENFWNSRKEKIATFGNNLKIEQNPELKEINNKMKI